MKKKYLIPSLLFICFSTFIYSCKNQNDWYQFVSEENNFKIKFPDQPVIHDPAFLGSGDVTIKIDQFDFKEGDLYYKALSYSYSEDIVRNAQGLDSLFNNFLYKTLIQDKGSIVHKTNIKLEEHPGKEFTIKFKDKETIDIIRIFLMENNRLQVNMVKKYNKTSSEHTPESDNDAKFFLDSFELINEY